VLCSWLERLGCEVIDAGILPDDLDQTRTCLAGLGAVDLILSTGGVSVGEADFLGIALREEGELALWKLAIKPGKPTIFGMAKGIPVFGLPGHPVAALTVCGQLVASAIHQMNGLEEEKALPGIPALLTRNIASAPGRDDLSM